MLRIGVDMLGFQHPAGRGRGISRYAEQFIAALARHDSNNEYISTTEASSLPRSCR